jgi:hypothetical protein
MAGPIENTTLTMKSFVNRCLVIGVSLVLLAGCGQQKPVPSAQSQAPERDPNLIETKLADGRMLQYTKQQLDEANSWGCPKGMYESELAHGSTHAEIIDYRKRHYWEKLHGTGAPMPAAGVTPPSEMRRN